LIQNSLDTDDFAASVALFTGFGNSKSLFFRTKGGRGVTAR